MSNKKFSPRRSVAFAAGTTFSTSSFQQSANSSLQQQQQAMFGDQPPPPRRVSKIVVTQLDARPTEVHPFAPQRPWAGAQSRSRRRMTQTFFSVGTKVINKNPGPGTYQDVMGPQTSRVAVMHKPAPPPGMASPLTARGAYTDETVLRGQQQNRHIVMTSPRSPSPPSSRQKHRNDSSKNSAAIAALPHVHTTGGISNPFQSILLNPPPNSYEPKLLPRGPQGTVFHRGERALDKRAGGVDLFKLSKAPGPSDYYPRLDVAGFAGRDRSQRKKKYRLPDLKTLKEQMDLKAHMASIDPEV
eukprot:PhM_4_TR11020/c0_g1_i1/m.22856